MASNFPPPNEYDEKNLTSPTGGRRDSTFEDHRRGSQFDPVNEGIVTEDVNKLKRNLHGRHMQMIAIGKSNWASTNRAYVWLTLFQVVPLALVSSSAQVVLSSQVVLLLW